MRVTRLQASNWRNFQTLDINLGSRLFVVGPNASGKSNLLDLFRFIADVSDDGLQTALSRRGGLTKVKSLFARHNRGGRLEIEFQLEDGDDTWNYQLAIQRQKGGHNLPIVQREFVSRNGKVLLDRPNKDDSDDSALLTQTHIEQISANRQFRTIADFFSQVRYFHPVPQLMREPARGLGEADARFGLNIIAEMNATPDKTRKAWLRRMEQALQSAVPGFKSLEIELDEAGRPHLIAGYKNWRANPSRQTEQEFSDGTLRLIGLLWIIVSTPARGGILLLEEPELSLNSAIVRQLPPMLSGVQRDKNTQVMLSTHAPELLDEEGVSPEEVIVIQVTGDGSQAHRMTDIEEIAGEIEADIPTSDIVRGIISPDDLSSLLKISRAS